MPEKIYTIPINEAFDQREGCPLCRLRDKLARQTLDFTLGAAMMEPAVRIEMNRQGFCHPHLTELLHMQNKLALGLILESHLDELTAALDAPAEGGKRGLFAKKAEGGDAAEDLGQRARSCFLCARIRNTEARYCSNVAWLWESDPKFREKLKGQPYFCLSHSAMLLKLAKAELKAPDYQSLYAALTALEKEALQNLRQDVTAFTVSFDHRSAGKPLTDSERSAVSRAVEMLR